MSVQDATPILTTDTATLSHTLERARIEQLPINGRNVMNLLATVPGITSGSDGVRVFGTRVGTFDVILDGKTTLFSKHEVGRFPEDDEVLVPLGEKLKK